MSSTVLEPLGHRPPRVLARTVCREAGDLCVEDEIGEEELRTLVGIELAVLETYSFLSREHGFRAVEECLDDEQCLEQLMDTSREASSLYAEDRYFFSASLDEIKLVVENLRKYLDEHDGAPPTATGKERGRTLA